METKTVYAYAADGKYIGERTLDDTDRSPISGAWQIPGNMTEAQPPTAKEGCDIYYKGGKWIQVERPKPEPEPKPKPPEGKSSPQSVDGGTTENDLNMAEALVEMAEEIETQREQLAALKAKIL
mgnify:CR=1 FL=1